MTATTINRNHLRTFTIKTILSACVQQCQSREWTNPQTGNAKLLAPGPKSS